MPVHIPLDTICVRSGLLCPRCEAKVRSGEYEEWEVDVMKALLEAGGKLDGEVRYVKSHRVGEEVYVFLEAPRGLPVWLGQELSRILESRVYVVEYSRDLRRLASNLLHPARVVGLDYSYLPDGSTLLQVKVDRSPRRGVEELARKVLGLVSGVEVVIQASGQAEAVDARPDKSDIRGALERIGL